LQMNVFDITGKRVDCLPLESGNLRFEYKLSTKGVYFFTITNSIGQLKYGKLIVL